jgi:hypothetical protein
MYNCVSASGISVLTFCISFQQLLDKLTEKIEASPTIIVYERDTSSGAIGREGYSLSIRGDLLSGGMHILQKLDIFDEMINESNLGTHFSLFNNHFCPIMELRSPSVDGLPQSSMRIASSK